jgi:hypothetical protein
LRPPSSHDGGRPDDYVASDDDDGASQEEIPFEEALHEMLGMINALSSGQGLVDSEHPLFDKE